MHVQQNAIFLINLSSVKLQDLPADDNGTYRHNGMRTWVFDVENDTTGRSRRNWLRRLPSNPNSYVLEEIA